jgi:hypothetical protein
MDNCYAVLNTMTIEQCYQRLSAEKKNISNVFVQHYIPPFYHKETSATQITMATLYHL